MGSSVYERLDGIYCTSCSRLIEQAIILTKSVIVGYVVSNSSKAVPTHLFGRLNQIIIRRTRPVPATGCAGNAFERGRYGPTDGWTERRRWRI